MESDPHPASFLDPAVSRELHAGPLRLVFERGWIRNVRLGNIEIIRRIYFALRDAYWNTIPGVIEELSLQQYSSSFLITYSSRHRLAPIDFLWHAEINGKVSGEISFSGRGIALSSFKKNRAGLCVLHPLDTCKGSPCRIETIDGATKESAFPRDIAPHQPFKNIRALSYAVASGLSATVRFEGDVFETEDQRNWTDATYKTYSTPLSLPAPVELEPGTLLTQKVTVHLDKPTVPLIHIPLSLQLELNDGTLGGRIPRIGAIEPSKSDLSPASIARTRALGLSHIRTDLFPQTGSPDDLIDAAAALARALGLPVELAIHFGSDPGAEAAAIAGRLKIAALPLSRFLLYSTAQKSVDGKTVSAAAPVLRSAFPAIPLAGGTDGYFVEINRNRPPVNLLDAITYAATPQVHTFDDVAIMENLPGVQETLDAAAIIATGKELAISPLTFRPRKKRDAPEKDGGYDERHQTLFAAAWLAGSLAYCVRGRAASITIGERCGPGGFFSCNGTVRYPLYFPLALVANDTGAPAECRLSSDPARVIALEWRRNDAFSALLINLAGKGCRIAVRRVPEPCRIAVLDDDCATGVWSGNDSAPVTGPATVKNNVCMVDLPPYAQAWLCAPRE